MRLKKESKPRKDDAYYSRTDQVSEGEQKYFEKWILALNTSAQVNASLDIPSSSYIACFSTEYFRYRSEAIFAFRLHLSSLPEPWSTLSGRRRRNLESQTSDASMFFRRHRWLHIAIKQWVRLRFDFQTPSHSLPCESGTAAQSTRWFVFN